MRKKTLTILLFTVMITTAACGNAETGKNNSSTEASMQMTAAPTEEAGYERVTAKPSERIENNQTTAAAVTPDITTTQPAATRHQPTTQTPTSKQQQTTQAPTTRQQQTTQALTTKQKTTQTPTTKQQQATQAPTTGQQPITPVPTTKQQTTTQPPTTVSSSNPDAYVDEVIRLINAERTKEGLNPITKSAVLTEAAQVRAKECVQVFSHTRPNGDDCFSIISEMGYSAYSLGENIAAGQQTPQAVMESWMNSSGHRDNILNPDFTEVGIGYYYEPNSTYKYYWTQMFARGLAKK